MQAVHAHIMYAYFTKILHANIKQFVEFLQRENFPANSRYYLIIEPVESSECPDVISLD